MTDSEARLILDAKSGNNRAFGRLVKKYQERILHLAYDLMGNYDDARDLAQETFIRAFQRLSQYQERAKFSTWLYKITVNLALDTHRKQNRNRIYSLDTMNDSVLPLMNLTARVPNLTRSLENRELKNRIDATLNRLTPNQRTVIILKYFHGKNSFEIAEIMGCQAATVRAHLLRALNNLRQLFYDTNRDKKINQKAQT